MGTKTKDFDLVNTVNYRIAVVEAQLRRMIYRIIAKNNLKITPEQWTVLYFLWDNEGLTIGELAEKIKKDLANTTRIVDKLIAMGFADKRKNSEDSRKYNVFATSEGKAQKSGLVECWETSLNITLNGISKEEQGTLIHLLKKVEANIYAELES